MARPLIAVTGPERGALGPRLLVALAIRLYGGRPLQLRPSSAVAPLDCQGVVLTGGHDVHPVLYAAEPEVAPKYDEARDALETGVIKQALAARLPVLGICRGAQLLNVVRGGTLIQDLRARRRLTSKRRTLLPLKPVAIRAGSRLHALLDTEICRVNSLHNQAIDRLGRDLRVCARDRDGLVQAIEDPGQPFLLGVQWHPEFLLHARRQRRLFRALVNASRAGLKA